jgi:hypothetical protein
MKLRVLVSILLLILPFGWSFSSSEAITLTHPHTSTALLPNNDLCTYRVAVTRFYCDTARDGGDAEFTLMFGVSGDIPLLGDLDRNGRHKPCVYRPSVNHFCCDTARNGGDAELVIAFGIANDIPLLGNVGRLFGVSIPVVTR